MFQDKPTLLMEYNYIKLEGTQQIFPERETHTKFRGLKVFVLLTKETERTLCV